MSGIVNSTGAVSGVIGTTVQAMVSGGKILQVTADVNGTGHTAITSTGTTYTDTVVTASITPTKADSKIIINCCHIFYIANTSNDTGLSYRWARAISGGATSYPNELKHYDDSSGAYGTWYGYNHSTATAGRHWEAVDLVTHCMIDSPATTSAVTYTLGCCGYGIETLQVGAPMQGRWHLYFIEVGA